MHSPEKKKKKKTTKQTNKNPKIYLVSFNCTQRKIKISYLAISVLTNTQTPVPFILGCSLPPLLLAYEPIHLTVPNPEICPRLTSPISPFL